FPPMLRAGYNIQVSAGSITAGGCLGILIPPSVLLIVYGATAGVSVVQLYAGAFLPGFMLAGLYVGYVIVLAKVRPNLMPPLPAEERKVTLSSVGQVLAQSGRNAFLGLTRSLGGAPGTSRGAIWGHWAVTVLPVLFFISVLGLTDWVATNPAIQQDTSGMVQAGGATAADIDQPSGLAGSSAMAPPSDEEETPKEAGAKTAEEPSAQAGGAGKATAEAQERLPTPNWFWLVLAICAVLLALLYRGWTWERLEVFKMLLTSFFPLAILILAVLGSIVFGLATPTEAAAVGAFGGLIMALVYRYIERWRKAGPGPGRVGEAAGRSIREIGGVLKESSFLTAKTSAMVCWLFVGSAIFSAAFALLGGQELVEKWVLSLNMTPLQFMILAQFIIFILGWPLEWTEIIVIFMPIFIPLLVKFNIDPLFFGLLVALNLQTAFLSPPVAMAAFYLKGVAPKHVTLNQIFGGMMPFMGIQIIALVLLYMFPGIGLWLPSVLYK